MSIAVSVVKTTIKEVNFEGNVIVNIYSKQDVNTCLESIDYCCFCH